jgi:NADH-quinone oxidoreductase subunit N
MTNVLTDLNHILPEVSLFIGAMVTLLTAAFLKNRQYLASVVLSLIVTACAAIILAFQFYNYFFEENSREVILNSMLCVDRYSTFCRILIIISGMLILFLMSAPNEEHKDRIFEMPILVMLSLMGMMLMVGSISLISLYLSMEIMSLPLYIIVASRKREVLSSEAGMKYFILGSLASGLFLFGASLVYGFTGQLSFEGIYASVDNTIDPALLFGIIFIITALCFKISAVPFHMWTPDVYQGAPTVVTAFLASAPKVAAFTLLGRLLFEPFFGAVNQWQQIIIFVSLASIIVGSVGAIVQKNFKRLLAYSSIGHMGFALAGFAAGDEKGLSSSLVYMLIYLTMTISIFACLLMIKREGKEVENIYDLNGISQHHPYLAFAIAVIMFSMAGVPPMAGFFAKFVVLQALIINGLYTTAVIFVIASVIAAFYYLNIVKIIYFDKFTASLDRKFAPALVFVAAIGVVFNLAYVLYPSVFIQLADSAVELLAKIV